MSLVLYVIVAATAFFWPDQDFELNEWGTIWGMTMQDGIGEMQGCFDLNIITCIAFQY